MVIKFLVLYFYFYMPSSNLNLRDYAKNNKVSLFISSVTSLNHQTGAQLFWRLNNDIRASLNANKNNKYVYNFLDKNNGSDTLKLYQQLELSFSKEKIWEIISDYRNNMYPLTHEDKRNKNQVFHESYWRFKNNPKSLVENIFSKKYENLYYSMQIPILLAQDIGPVKSDRLFLKANLEIIKKNPEIKKELLKSILYLHINTSPSYDWYNYNAIKNIGNCAYTDLSKNIYSQYSNSYDKNSYFNNYISATIKKIVASIKHYSRNLFGILFVVLILILPFSKQKILVIFLLFNFLSTAILVGLFAGITSSKYENYINVFLYYILFLLSITLLNYLKKILHNRIKYKL